MGRLDGYMRAQADLLSTQAELLETQAALLEAQAAVLEAVKTLLQAVQQALATINQKTPPLVNGKVPSHSSIDVPGTVGAVPVKSVLGGLL